MILVDIGNSGLRATHVPDGQHFDPELNSVFRLSWTAAGSVQNKPSPKQSAAPNQRWCDKNDESAFDWLLSKFWQYPQDRWLISSVQQTVCHILLQRIASIQPLAELYRVQYSDIPMRCRVDAPEKTGIDRLLAAFGAKQLFVGQGDPIIIVQAGTAITVDWVDHDGAYCGGAIMPGLGLSLQFLAAGTDQLPWLGNHAVDAQPILPGKNTVQAISVGVNAAIVGGTLHLIQRYREPVSNTKVARVVITGGDGKMIVPHVIPPVTYVDHLIFAGLSSLAQHRDR